MPHSELLSLGDRSFADWLRVGTLGELHDALRAFSSPTERARRRQARLIECLAVVAGQHGTMRARLLRDPLVDGMDWARAIATGYTDMPTIEIP